MALRIGDDQRAQLNNLLCIDETFADLDTSSVSRMSIGCKASPTHTDPDQHQHLRESNDTWGSVTSSVISWRSSLIAAQSMDDDP